MYHNILFIFQTAQAAQRARPNHTIQRITRIPVHNAEMTQSLPGPGCAHSPTPHTALPAAKQQVYCAGAAARRTLIKCYRIAVLFWREAHMAWPGWPLGVPSCQNPKLHFLLSGSPRSSSLQAAHQMCQNSLSHSHIYMSQSNPRTTEKPIQLNRSAVTRSPLSSPCGRSHHPGTGGNPGNQHLPQKTLRARRRLLEMVSPNHSSDKENKTWH